MAVIFEETITTVDTGAGYCGRTLAYKQKISEDQIKITINGVPYIWSANKDGANYSYGGTVSSMFSEYPFMLLAHQSSSAINTFLSETAGTYTVKAETYERAINKVVYGNQTLIDLTSDTVTPETLFEGYTAHDKSGALITGTASQQSLLITDTIDEHGGTIRTITGKVVQLQTKTITPTSSQQVVNPDAGYDGFSQVTVEAGGSTINNQNKTVTPTESQQSITADSGYTGLGTVTVNAISSTYVGTEVTRRSSTDLTASGATVTVPSGYYSAQASKAVASGSATPAASISGTGAAVSTGTNTLTLTKTVSNTPQVSSGYISSGTAGNTEVSLSASVTTKGAATITPGTSSQTISSGTYLTGTQTITGDSDLTAANIKNGVQIFGVTGTYTSDANAAATDIVSGKTAYINGSKVTGSLVINKYYTGSSAPSASLGDDGDIYFKTN